MDAAESKVGGAKPASLHTQVLEHFFCALREREGMSAPVVDAIAALTKKPIGVSRDALLRAVKEAVVRE
jgi:hypothetical protein